MLRLFHNVSAFYGYAGNTLQDSIYATDFEGDDNSWNIVQIGGSWYYVDACWDDPILTFTDRPVRHKILTSQKNT